MGYFGSTFVDVLIIGGTLFLILYIYLTKDHNYFKKRNIPHLKSRLLFGNLGDNAILQKSLADVSNDIYKALDGHRIGGMFSFTMPVFMVRDPDMLKLIMVKDFDHFVDHMPAMLDDADPLFAANLFTRRGEKWKHMRHTLTPAFTSSKMKVMFGLVVECAAQLSNYLQERIKQSGQGRISADMKDIMTRFTNDAIASCAFGISCDSLKNPNNEFYKAGRKLTNFGGIRSIIFLGFVMFPKIMTWLNFDFLDKASSNFLCELVKNSIKRREEENIVRYDLIHLLIQAKKGTLKDTDTTSEDKIDNTQRITLSDTDIAAQAMAFFFAGFETVSTLICFSSLLLAMHPDIQEKLIEEVDRTMAENQGKITYEMIHSMKYLDMVVSETLRMYPPTTHTSRVCTKQYTIPASDDQLELTIEQDRLIWIPIYPLQHDPKYFPNPERFDPERFSDENKGNIKPYTFMPFGVGPRSCIGNRLALMEDKIVLVTLLSKFSFQIIDKSPIPIKLVTQGFNTTVKNGFWLGVKLRHTEE